MIQLMLGKFFFLMVLEAKDTGPSSKVWSVALREEAHTSLIGNRKQGMYGSRFNWSFDSVFREFLLGF